MPTQTSYPGVYIEELPSPVRTISSVTTSVTAFVGATRWGPLNTPVTITGFADFERRFGGLDPNSPAGYAVHQFFLNGGNLAVIVRVANGAVAAWVGLGGGGDDPAALTVQSRDAGAAGNLLRVAIDPDPDSSRFGLRVLDESGIQQEVHRELSMDAADPRFVETVVNSQSTLVKVAAAGTALPPLSGTISAGLSGGVPDLAGKTLTATAGEETVEIQPVPEGETGPADVVQLALLLERTLRQASTARSFTAATVNVRGSRLQVLAGELDVPLALSGAVATDLGFGPPGPTAYVLEHGDDGQPPELGDILGTEVDKTGLHALLDVQDVNLLCLPDLADSERFDDGRRLTALSVATRLCATKRMFLIADSPSAWNTLDAARAGLPAYDSVRSSHAALFFPHLQMTDPLTGRLRDFPPCGAIAGVLARTDAERGVWKAPAGTEARLSGVRSLTVRLNDQENGLLNPLGVNCLRTFPIVGPVVWGARTLVGADLLADQWKYLPVRRTALMIEESLYRGTQWVVFEPNDESLWSSIRLNVGAFMHSLFRLGAFQGTSAREAYFVKCDAETTTQDDINRGVVNILVGFRPLKPAEFVIIKIEQMAGEIDI